jgi:hypothetical protein
MDKEDALALLDLMRLLMVYPTPIADPKVLACAYVALSRHAGEEAITLTADRRETAADPETLGGP